MSRDKNNNLKNDYNVEIARIWQNHDKNRGSALKGFFYLILILPVILLFLWLVFKVLFWLATF